MRQDNVIVAVVRRPVTTAPLGELVVGEVLLRLAWEELLQHGRHQEMGFSEAMAWPPAHVFFSVAQCQWLKTELGRLIFVAPLSPAGVVVAHKLRWYASWVCRAGPAQALMLSVPRPNLAQRLGIPVEPAAAGRRYPLAG